jgi:polyphosphate kinase 2 (PPK2 family)
MGRLDELDLSLKLSKEEEAERLADGWKRLGALRLALGAKLPGYGLGPPVCVLFEGWDASGKGGAIRRLVAPLDLRHVRVAQFAAPTPDEKRHHFLWRFWPQLPGWGGMAVFDRSWYGRVLVERVEKFCSEAEWKRAYREINEFERQLVDDGAILLKFFLFISKDEQLDRFKAREADPYKHWKISDEDWRNRRHWKQNVVAAQDMLKLTSTDLAPWQVIGANYKWHTRVKVVRAIADALEEALPKA